MHIKNLKRCFFIKLVSFYSNRSLGKISETVFNFVSIIISINSLPLTKWSNGYLSQLVLRLSGKENKRNGFDLWNIVAFFKTSDDCFCLWIPMLSYCLYVPAYFAFNNFIFLCLLEIANSKLCGEKKKNNKQLKTCFQLC